MFSWLSACAISFAEIFVAEAAEYRYRIAGNATSSLSDPIAWSPAVVNWADASMDVFGFSCGGTATLSQGESFAANQLLVGWGQLATPDGNGGWNWSNSLEHDLGATLEMSGGSISLGDCLWIGASYADRSDSIVNISGGKITAGKLLVANCSCTSGKKVELNISGSGEVEATSEADDGILLSIWHLGTSSINVSESGLLSVHSPLRVGYNGRAFINVAGGLVRAHPSDHSVVHALGYNSGSFGALNVTGGEFNALGNLDVGKNGAGEILVDGGRLNLNWFQPYIGRERGSTGVVHVVSGELNCGADIYVGYSGKGTLVVDGGTVSSGWWLDIARESDNDADICLFEFNGGTLETGKIQHNAGRNTGAGNPTMIWNGGVFKPNGNYGDSGDMDIFPATKIALDIRAGGAIVDTNGKAREIGHDLKGEGAFTKRGAGSLLLKGAVDVRGGFAAEEGELALAAGALATPSNVVVKSVVIADGASLNLGGAMLRAERCEIAGVQRSGVISLGEGAGYVVVVTPFAYWTNALGDGDVANPANWDCRDSDGNSIPGVLPMEETAVLLRPGADFSTIAMFDGVGSEVVLALDDTALLDGDAKLPAALSGAIAWYDLGDESTVTSEDGALVSIRNKGRGGSALDGEAVSNGRKSAWGLNKLNGMNVMSMTNSHGFASASACGISGDSDRTLVVLSRHMPNTYPNGDSGYYGSCYPLGIECDDDTGAFRIEDWGYWDRLFYNRQWLSGIGYDSSKDWQIWTMRSADRNVSATRWTASLGLVSTTNHLAEALNTDADSKIYVGLRHMYNSPSAGDIAEALVFDRALGDGEMEEIRTYLRRKWLSIPDPARVPSSVSLGDGATLDLGGATVSLENVYGCGSILNGTVSAVTGSVPTGVTLAGAPDLSGCTLKVVVDEDGDVGEPLVVGEGIDVSKLKVEISGVANLLSDKHVVILRAQSGFISGKIWHWNVAKDDKSVGCKFQVIDGELRLCRTDGLVFGLSSDYVSTSRVPPPIHVEGRHFVDDSGHCVRLMGGMRSIHPFFDSGRWGGGRDAEAAAKAIAYYEKLFDGFADRAQGSYANMIRLTDDGHWSWNASLKPSDDAESFYACDWPMYTNYVQNVLVPIAERAVERGLYVIIRPSHNTPGDTYVGCEYQKHLMKEWAVLASNKRLQAMSGQILFELENEPTRIYETEELKAAKQETNPALAAFMQPLIDTVRANGFDGVVLVPGIGYQSWFAALETNPVKGENLGYAVHVYPGWYNQKDETADEDRFVANFLRSVPVVMTAPCVVTEVDWSPIAEGSGKYNEFGEWVESNIGTWGTGSSSKWGKAYFGMLERFGNVSTLAGDTHVYMDTTNYLATGKVVPAFGGNPECCGAAFFKLFAKWAKERPETPAERDLRAPHPLLGDETDLTRVSELASNFFRMTTDKKELHIYVKPYNSWDFRYGDPIPVGRNEDYAHLFKAIPRVVDGKLHYTLKCYNDLGVVRLCGSDYSQGDSLCMSSNWNGCDQDSSRENSDIPYGRKQAYDGLWDIEAVDGGFTFKNVAMGLWLGQAGNSHSSTAVVWRCTTRIAAEGAKAAAKSFDYDAFLAPAEYRNPVLFTDCPDVSMCRSGEYVYMVSTTMHMVPGCPVMRSKDMVHWEIVSYVVDQYGDGEWPEYSLATDVGGTGYTAGQWASTIREHNGKFYVFFIINGHNGFLYSADSPEGPWTLRNKMPYLHDSSLLFDDDGSAYMFYGTGWVCRLKDDLTDVDPNWPAHRFFDTQAEGETALIEGSNAFKKDGWYYVMMVSGYLAGHPRREVCFRSRSLDSETWEKKVILETTFDWHGGVGQGAVVEMANGEWMALVFQDRGGIGRTPCLMPVRWEDGWPMLGDMLGRIPNNVALPYPNLDGVACSDDFSSARLKLCWQWNHNPDNDAWSLSERPGFMRLKTSGVADNLFLARNTLTQRTVGPACAGVAKLDVSGMKNGDHAGICAFQGNSAVVEVVMENGVKRVVMSRQTGQWSSHDGYRCVDGVEYEEFASAEFSGNEIWMRVECEFSGDKATTSWSLDGENWNASSKNVWIPFNTGTMFMGTRFALFNYATSESGGHVDFDVFELTSEGHE